MKRLIVKTIEDLGRNDPRYLTELVAKWDPARELMDWAPKARQFKYQSIIDWNGDRDACFHPSSLHHGCDRFLYFEMLGTEPAGGDDSGARFVTRRFDTGTAVHALMHYYQHTMAQTLGHVYRDEYNIKGKSRAVPLHLGGRIDGVMSRIVTIPEVELELRLGWEYKTCSVKAFEERKERGPEKKHLLQCHPYMWVMNLPFMIIVYYRKDDGMMCSYPVFFNGAIWAGIESRLESILDHHQRGELPPGRDLKGCRSCAFFAPCKPKEAQPSYKRIKWDDNEG